MQTHTKERLLRYRQQYERQKIILKMQPNYTYTCGHHCVAMIANVEPADAIQMIGHQRSTKAKELSKALAGFKIKAAEKLVRFSNEDQLPDLCIIRIKYKTGGGHWAVYHKGTCYDPAFGEFEYYDNAWYKQDGKPTSYLQISNL